MPTFTRLLLLCGLCALVACSGTSDTPADVDAGASDSGPTVDAGPADAGDTDAGTDGGESTFCVPNESVSCYTGPDNTAGVGRCQSGQKTCLPDGSAFGACDGEVVPTNEDCTTATDEDCDGQILDVEDGCLCEPGKQRSCYTGAEGTENHGLCKPGEQTCDASGQSWGACLGEVVPSPESCINLEDDNCDGVINDGCPCIPDSTVDCYSGPMGTKDVGVCKGGTATCNASGTAFGPCIGEVVPATESCFTLEEDDDCDGQVNEGGDGCICPPNGEVDCYTGPMGTANVGACKSGKALCNAAGTALGPCLGEVTPQTETCTTPVDDDCDGQTNESGDGCLCLPNSTASCYTGPAGTSGVGVCKAGTKTCNAQGTAYGTCTGEVIPAAENCSTPGDDNCDGQVNEGCPITYATSVKPIFAAKCATCHTTGYSGGHNIGTSYADTQLASYYCPGKTKGECALVRIQNGSMPQGAGCSGNPATDSGHAACLTAAEQAMIQSWITGGQLP
jgi:hypothetical protein